MTFLLIFCTSCRPDLRYLRSFPTRRSSDLLLAGVRHGQQVLAVELEFRMDLIVEGVSGSAGAGAQRAAALDHEVRDRSEEHTSELQSRGHLVCRLLLEKKK